MELRINETLKMTTDIPLNKVTSFHMQWGVNDHARLVLCGEVSYEAAIEYQNRTYTGDRIAVAYGEEQQEQILFNGLVRNSMISFEGRTAQIEIEGISATWKLDITKKCRSFQDTDITYAALAKRIAAYTGTDIIPLIGKNTTISEPLIQYQETDWEFLRRISSHLNKFILCDVLTGKPAFWFGMRKGERIVLSTEHSYHSNFDPILKRQTYIVNSRKVYQIGDRVTFMGEDMIVLHRELVFNGELIFTYTLGNESVLDQDMQYNDNVSGRGLLGNVIAVSGEKLKIRLKIDGNEECGEYWFSWQPETGNIMYAMPEIGSPVLLSIPGSDERSAIVSVCLHKEVALVNRERSFSKRRLKTVEGSLFKLYPNELEFSRKDGDHSLNLNDSISCKTNKSIKIEARKNVYIKGSSAIIKASEEIDGVVG